MLKKTLVYLPAFLIGLAVHLFIIGLNQSIAERLPFIWLRTFVYGFGLVFLGIGFFKPQGELSTTRKIFNTLVVLGLISLAYIPLTVFDWDAVMRWINNKKQGAPDFFNISGIVLLLSLFLLASFFFYLWGKRFAIELRSELNAVLVLISYSTGFLLGFLLAIVLKPGFGPATLIALSAVTLLFFIYRNTYVKVAMTTGGLVLAALLFTLVEPKLYTLDIKNPRHEHTVWSAYHRLDFISHRAAEGELLTAFYNYMPMWTTGPTLKDDELPTALLKNQLPENAKVLLVGSGGGRTLSLIVQEKMKIKMVANEIDDQVIKTMQGRFARYNNSGYNQPFVRVIPGDGRLAMQQLLREGETFDRIIIEGPDTRIVSQSRSVIPIDNYLFTRESAQTLTKLLKPGGLLLNYMTGSTLADVEYSLAALTGLFQYRYIFSAVDQMPPFKGLPICYIVAAQKASTLSEFLKAIPETYQFENNVIPAEKALSDERPVLFGQTFAYVLSVVVVLLVLLIIPFFKRGGFYRDWLNGFLALLLGLGFTILELYVLDRYSREFVSPALGLALSLVVFLSGGIIGLWLVEYRRNTGYIVVTALTGFCLLLPLGGHGSLLISAVAGFLAGLPLPFVFKHILKDHGFARFYGLDSLGAVTGLFLYYLVFLWGGYSAVQNTVISLYIAIAALLVFKATRITARPA